MFNFQQGSAPAHAKKKHSSCYAKRHRPGFILRDQWSPNSPERNRADYKIWAVSVIQQGIYQ